jgi:hypothetical protein
MQHTLGVQAEAADESALGPPPHMLRGQLSGFGQVRWGAAHGLPSCSRWATPRKPDVCETAGQSEAGMAALYQWVEHRQQRYHVCRWR